MVRTTVAMFVLDGSPFTTLSCQHCLVCFRCLEAGGDMTVGTFTTRPTCDCDGKQFLSLTDTEHLRGGIFSLKLGENFNNLGDLGLASWGLTSCFSGGFIVGIRTSVKVLLSRLWSEREGRSAWLGVGVVGVQKLFCLPEYKEGVG